MPTSCCAPRRCASPAATAPKPRDGGNVSRRAAPATRPPLRSCNSALGRPPPSPLLVKEGGARIPPPSQGGGQGGGFKHPASFTRRGSGGGFKKSSPSFIRRG